MSAINLPRPDFYIAAIGRSGSTLLCDWLTNPPDEIVLSEPFFFSDINPNMLRIQLENFGYDISDADWRQADETWKARFTRLFEPFLSGRRWGFKEVLAEEHDRVLAQFKPSKVVVSVRNIRDVAASFLEKHKIQQNLDRFDHNWVANYCLVQSEALVAFCRRLNANRQSHLVQRYEDFLLAESARRALAEFVGWQGGGETGRHLDRLDRGFELERHGTAVNDRQRQFGDRDLDSAEIRLIDEIVERCTSYQQYFGYDRS